MHSSRMILPIGIDLGSSGVKLIQLQASGEQFSIRAAAKADFPPGFQDQDEEQRRAFITDAVRDILKKHRFKGRHAVTAVPNYAVQFKSFRVPRMPADELDNAVLFEAEERFAFQTSEAEYRYLDAGEIRQGQERRQEIIAMGSTAAALRAHLGILKQVGLVCDAIDVGPCAVTRCLQREVADHNSPGQAHIYADLGELATRIITTIDDKIVFLKSIAIGSRKMNELAARRLNLSLAEATQLRQDILRQHAGTRGNGASDLQAEIMDSAFQAMRPGLEELGKEISLCLRYYAVTFRGIRPNELLCVGGQSYDTQLLRTIGEITGVQAIKGSPLKNIDTTDVFSESESASGLVEWATCAGLSLRGWVETTVSKVTT